VLRYLIVSTVIVVGAAVLATAWINRDLIRIKIGGSHVRGPARGGAGIAWSHGTAALHGDAPWALSALPECLRQTSESFGSDAYVRARLPQHATRVVPPATLVYGDCTISIAGGEAFVQRASDRLRIPPPIEFFRAPGLLALLRETPHGAQLRVYEPAQH
jgi:hypothetical protein